MLNSTKTWQEKWEETNAKNKLIDLMFTNKPSVVLSLEGAILQFISELRKRDMEALIKRLDYLDNNREEHQIIGEFKQLIKEYYEN